MSWLAKNIQRSVPPQQQPQVVYVQVPPGQVPQQQQVVYQQAQPVQNVFDMKITSPQQRNALFEQKAHLGWGGSKALRSQVSTTCPSCQEEAYFPPTNGAATVCMTCGYNSKTGVAPGDPSNQMQS